MLKKNGSLRIVHDLQPLNKVTIRDAGGPPILDDFVEPFAGRSCYTVFDLYSGYDSCLLHVKSRDLTSFQTPLGLLCIAGMCHRVLPIHLLNFSDVWPLFYKMKFPIQLKYSLTTCLLKGHQTNT